MNPNNPSVLCVDDEPNILRSLHWMLHKEFNVMTAPDGATALEMLRRHDFDVIVSDQRMPGMIGSEFLRQACEIAPRAMRILLTGYSDMQALLKSINDGEVFRFVNKPWKNDELSRTVREAAEIARMHTSGFSPSSLSPLEAIAGAEEHVLVLDTDPELANLVEQVMAPGTELYRASTLPEAIAILGASPISVLVSETRVGRTDTTAMLRMLKQSHPEIVSVVVTAETDVDAVVKLINQGQVYRFIPKPVKAGFLKILLASALQKHHELVKVPATLKRHAVERVPESLREQLFQLVAHEAARTPPGGAAANSGFFEKIGGSFRRLFA
ncbi:response regulator [Ramlibacter montanisoli]|uniref:Response regulator n=1 Tax=Ramlibacter montanisoli TaxID=2732512 RepID=A0A849K159_9BURK|nr:response regulator [Ramlibacter montanisoli]NNU42258.1 response regulator [Ramlibacter montanisoli]